MKNTGGPENSSRIIRCKRLIVGPPQKAPVENGAIVHDGRTIRDIGPYALLRKIHTGPTTDLGDVTIAPGLVNAHCHLKLSKLDGKTVSGQGFVPWLLSMLQQDYKQADFNAVKQAVDDAKADGTIGFGDVVSVDDIRIADILADAGLYFVLFCETFGFLPTDLQAADIPYRKTGFGEIVGGGHAVYTTSASVLQAVKTRNRAQGSPFSIHVAEHGDEIGMLLGEKTGFYNLLEQNGMLGNGYTPPMKTPVEHCRDLGLLDASTLAVHCVQVTDGDIRALAETRTHVCLCPRSNDFIGVGRAPWEKIMDAGIRVCLGTDSLASNHDLNLWNELAFFVRQFEGNLSISEAISLVTHNPANALGMGGRLGALEKGRPLQYAVMPRDVAALF